MASWPTIEIPPGGPKEDRITTITLGKGVRIGRGLTLEIYAGGKNELTIRDGARIRNNVRLVMRSGSIQIGPRCDVRDSAWLKSDGSIRTGQKVTIGPFSAIHCTDGVELADLVGIGERVSLIDSDHTFDGSDSHYMDKPLTVAPIKIGRQTMIAFGSVVLKGVEIGANAVVGANSVVRRGTYADASLISGNPATVVKDLASGMSGE